MEKNRICHKNGDNFNENRFIRLINVGKKSSVYSDEFEHVAFKRYHFTTSKDDKLSERVFKELQDINCPALPILGECLYYGKRSLLNKELAGYTMDFVKNDHTDILTMDSKDFTDKIVDKFDLVADNLGERNIIMTGTPDHSDVILSSDGITITGIDSFERKTNMPKWECVIFNKKMAICYLRLLLAECAMYRHDLGDKSQDIAKIFDFSISATTNISSKTLVNLEHGQVIKSLKK
ncbi:MAG: hypothetical protein IKE10_00345 [Bacilli bacterium]|nr:hypothetical protein [Bacilli bacterium]